MSVGMISRRNTSTTSLSKYYHEMPDPDQSSADFCNAFWGLNDCGVEVLFARMRGAARTMEELRGFWRERIAIEEDYAKRLAKLAKLPVGRDEIGDLKAALDNLRVETDKQSQTHLTFAQNMKREIDQPSSDFIQKQNTHKKTFQTSIEKSWKAKQTQEKYVEKARERYEADCVHINSYTAQSTLLQGKELDKIQMKLERAQQTVQANERDYQNFARALADTARRWEGEWKTYCDQCQDLEDERIEFIKDNVWAYANAVSTVCVSDDESCEKMRIALETVEAEKEVENFVREYGTGPVIQEPQGFISYKTSSPPSGPKTKQSNFMRSSIRAPLMRQAPPPREEEPAGPGAAGIGAGSRDSQAGFRDPPVPRSNTAASSTAQSAAQRQSTLYSGVAAPVPQPSVTPSRPPQAQPQATQAQGRSALEPQTMISIGGNAYSVDPTADPQTTRTYRGPVGDDNDPIAQALDALKKGGGVTRNGIGSIRSKAGTSPAPVTSPPNRSTNIAEERPQPQRKKTLDLADAANSVIGGPPPDARPTSPAHAAMMIPPQSSTGPMSNVHQQAFPGERRLSFNRGQSGQSGPQVARSPSPARDGFAGIGAQGRSPSPQLYQQSTGYSQQGYQQPQQQPQQQQQQQQQQNRPLSSAGGRPLSSAGYRATSPSLGIALDASGQVAHDAMAEEYARRNAYQQPQQHQPPPQQYSQQSSQYNQYQNYQTPQQTGYSQPQQYRGPSPGPNGYNAGYDQQQAYGQQGYPNQQQGYPGANGQPTQQRAPSPSRAPSPAHAPAPSGLPPSQGPQPPSSQIADDGSGVLFYVKALYDYQAQIPEEFDFTAGDIIAVTATPDDGWWSGYTALRGPAGQPQSAQETIVKLADRLTQSTLISDRRAAVLGLKGLSRDCKADVGQYALDALLSLLDTDAKDDVDSGKAILETLLVLCQVEVKEGGKIPRDDLGLRHTDVALSSPTPSHALLALLQDNSFYIRLHAVQLASLFLANRPHLFQQHFQHFPDGPGLIEQLLTDQRDIIRAESLTMLQVLVANNPAIQTSVAFAGAFEKLLNIVGMEGGVEGGPTVYEALVTIQALMKHNVGTQKFFRDLEFTSQLPALLLFPSPPPAPDQPVPQEFSLQFWNAQKITNAGAVVDICQMLIAGKGEMNQAPDVGGISRCLVELALASNAPTSLKTKALRALPPDPPLLNLVTCYIPVPETNGEEWDRLPSEPAVGVLVAYALDGDFGMPNSIELVGPDARRESLELRAAALSTFEAFVTNDLNARLFILGEMAQPTPLPAGAETTRLPFRSLVRALSDTPQTPMTPEAAHRHQISSLIFTALIRGSEKCKTLARAVIPSVVAPPTVFLDPQTEKPPVPDDDDEPPQALLPTLLGNVTIAIRSRSISRERGDRDMREWDRVIVAYLIILSAWVWDNPVAVKDVLEEGGIMTVLIEPVAQSSGMDVLVQGLCAFVLGACYEFNREPGEITRATLQPIFHKRIGADTFVSRMARVREDARFKAIGPETLVVDVVVDEAGTPGQASALVVGESATDGEGEIWMDWAFVEFWKEHYYTIQKGITNDPNSAAAEVGGNLDTAALITSLRSMIQSQQSDIERLQAKLGEVNKEREEERESLNGQITSLSERLTELSSEIEAEKEKKKEVEKEQEDLLVLLEELNTKRRRDKELMREKGLEVSEDEGDDEDEDDEDEDEDEDEDDEDDEEEEKE